MPYLRVQDFSLKAKLKSLVDTNNPAFTTRLSLFFCIILTVFGVLIGYTENSLAVFTNGLLSGIDVINSGIFLLAVNRSMKSPDYIFNYGYGKYESLSLLAGTGFLLAITFYTLSEAIQTIISPAPASGNYFLLIGYSSFSMVVMVAMYRVQKAAARKHKMTILEFDSELWKTDSIIEALVLGNLLVGITLTYFDMIKVAMVLDSLIALFVLAYAMKIPLRGSKEALDQLLDKTLPESDQLSIISVIAESVEQMCEFKSVHTRRSGKDIFIEIDVILPFDSSIAEKYQAEDVITRRLKEVFPTSVPRLYGIPCSGECITTDGSSNCPLRQAIVSNKDVRINKVNPDVKEQ